VKAQQMMSAGDIAFRGNPGNTFSSILRNRDFERRPLHAWHVFLFVMHPMLVLFIKIKTRHFFLCFHYLTSIRAAIINFGVVVICCCSGAPIFVHHDIDAHGASAWCTINSTDIKVHGYVHPNFS
jgi:hypothetical protein